MRKGFNGLALLAQETLRLDPFSGHLFVFRGRRGSLIKVLWLFAGSDRGGERAAAMLNLIETAKLNGDDPEAWLADVLRRIAEHPASRLHQLLPWHWKLLTRSATA